MLAKVYIPGDLDLKKTKWVEGPEYACQKIKQVLSFLRGEWDWDTSLGLSYYRDILVKGPNTALIRGIYVKEILSVRGIVSVEELTLELNPASRLLSVTFAATYRDETGDTALRSKVSE